MSSRTKRIILFIAILQIVLIVVLLILPGIVLAIPGRYRVALSERNAFLSQLAEGIIEQVSPVGEALPAPAIVADQPRVTIPAFRRTETGLPTQTPTAEAEIIAENTVTAGEEVAEEAEPVATPTMAPTTTPTVTPTPTPIPDHIQLVGINRIQQSFNNCGPANLTQVLNWYGDETTQTEAAAYLKPNPEDRNVSPWQLSDYVNEFSELRSTVHSGGDIELVKRLVAAGFPVVIEKGYEPNTDGASGWFGHYLTVFGYDDREGVLYSMDTYLKVDPVNGRADPYEEIERYWQHFNYTFYVVYEPEQEQEVLELIGPELLDPLTMWESAAMQAQEDIEKDPENAFAWFNLGTSLTRMGEITGETEFYENGAAAFDQARTIGLPPRMLWYEFRPYLAYMKIGRYDDMLEIADAVFATQGGLNVEETYLYQGHALLFQGDVNGAANAYERALQLNENFYPAEIALQSLG
ncbi:MAG: C39 family peptidase [Chloroflexota bacterium]|jgi:hypothetical protein